MTKRIKKHVKRQVIKNQPILPSIPEMSEEEKKRFEVEKQFAMAFSHQLGEILGKHVKKVSKQCKEVDDVKNDPYVRFLNDLQLILIKSYDISADDVIHCDTSLLPPKLKRLNVTAEETDGCKTSMRNMLMGSGVLLSIANQCSPESGEAQYIAKVGSDLQQSANWLGSVFGITMDELTDSE